MKAFLLKVCKQIESHLGAAILAFLVFAAAHIIYMNGYNKGFDIGRVYEVWNQKKPAEE